MTTQSYLKSKSNIPWLALLSLAFLSGCAYQESIKSEQSIRSHKVSADVVGQSFIASHDYLAAIEFQIGVKDGGYIFEEEVTLDIWNFPQGEGPIRSVRLTEEDLNLDKYSRAEFPPIPHISGEMLLFTLDLHQAGNLFVHTTEYDSYEFGQLHIAGYPTSMDLTFRALYRPPPWVIVREGMERACDSIQALAVIIFMLGSSGVLVTSVVRRFYKLDLTSAVALGMGAGPVLLVLVAYVLVGAGVSLCKMVLWPLTLIMLVSGLILSATAKILPHWKSLLQLAIFLGLLTFLSFTRMSFLAEQAVPAYSDSVEHYSITENLINPENDRQSVYSFGTITTRYYHFGFHMLAAWAAILSRNNLLEIIAVLGQVIQVLAAASLYFPAYLITKDFRLSLLAVVIGCLGWPMPSYASNWGKFPALAALATIPAALGFAIITMRSKGKERMIALIFTCILVIGSFLLHSRSAILLIVAGTAFWLANKFGDIHLDQRKTIVFVVLFASGVFIGACLFNRMSLTLVIQEIWVRYRSGYGWLSLLILGLSTLIAFNRNRFQILVPIIVMILMLAVTIGPLPVIPTGRLLDRTFIEMSLYMPLTFLAIIVIWSLRESQLDTKCAKSVVFFRQLLGYLIAFIIIIVGFSNQTFWPKSFGQLLSNDDVQAMEWIETQSPTSSVVLIPAIEAGPDYRVGVDGGAWIQALTKREMQLWSYSHNLGEVHSHNQICGEGISHVYLGSNNYSFTRQDFSDRQRYLPVFVRPKAAVYEVISCP
jgi:hypothetical protein